MRRGIFKPSGHCRGSPSGVFVQSRPRMRCAISLSPGNISASSSSEADKPALTIGDGWMKADMGGNGDVYKYSLIHPSHTYPEQHAAASTGSRNGSSRLPGTASGKLLKYMILFEIWWAM